MEQHDTVQWDEVYAATFGDTPMGAVALRGARKKANLTQTALAEAIGVSQPDIANMERGKRPIGKAMARRLAEVLDIDYRALV